MNKKSKVLDPFSASSEFNEWITTIQNVCHISLDVQYGYLSLSFPIQYGSYFELENNHRWQK